MFHNKIPFLFLFFFVILFTWLKCIPDKECTCSPQYEHSRIIIRHTDPFLRISKSKEKKSPMPTIEGNLSMTWADTVKYGFPLTAEVQSAMLSYCSHWKAACDDNDEKHASIERYKAAEILKQMLIKQDSLARVDKKDSIRRVDIQDSIRYKRQQDSNKNAKKQHGVGFDHQSAPLKPVSSLVKMISFQGYVSDDETLEPINGASIRLEQNDSILTSSNTEGRFSFQLKPNISDPVMIRVQKKGYETGTRSLSIHNNGNSQSCKLSKK